MNYSGRPVTSLTQQQAIRLLENNGPNAVLYASTLWSNYAARRASAEQQRAYQAASRAIPELVKAVEEKTIHILPDAFNGGAQFLAVALASVDAIKHIEAALDGIKAELTRQNIAERQAGAQRPG